jgi:hypothetical protein
LKADSLSFCLPGSALSQHLCTAFVLRKKGKREYVWIFLSCLCDFLLFEPQRKVLQERLEGSRLFFFLNFTH